MGFLSEFVPAALRGTGAQQTSVMTGFRTFTETAPSFSAWDGTLYEQAQTRAIVECIATHCSKLKPEFVTPEGSRGSIPRVQQLFTSWPNDYMTWPDFLRRLATILYVDTTAYVVPQYDRDLNVTGLFPLKPSYAEVVELDGEPYVRFTLMTGEKATYRFYDVCILSRFQNTSDFFGGGNMPLTPTLRLMDAQRQAEELALQNGARIRFIGKLGGLVHERDMDAKRKRFSESNLGPANTSGLLLYDQTFEDIKQIDEQHFTIDADGMARIDKALFTYFGINENILQAKYNEEEWGAFYESVIEPFAIKLGESLTKMLLTATQVRKGNHVMFSSSRLEYATPETKLKVVSALMDRGGMTFNQSLDVFQLPHMPGGDVRMIRGEYYLLDEDNNIIAESGGHSDAERVKATEVADPNEPPDEDAPDEPDDLLDSDERDN